MRFAGFGQLGGPEPESEDSMPGHGSGARRRVRAAVGQRCGRTGRWVGVVSVGLVGLVWLASTAFAAVVQVPVLTTPRDEFQAAASDAYLAWSQNSRAHPHLYSVYERPTGGGARVQVNHAGTQGFMGGIDGNTLIYQQIKRGQSDIKLFSLVTHHRSNPPFGVSTPGWEYYPTISGAWILFGRQRPLIHRRLIVLYNLSTHRHVVLADSPEGPTNNPSLVPGQVNGNFAVWQQCTATACNVWEYDIAAATTTRLPSATLGRFNYSPSVDSTGTAYFAHGVSACGVDIEKRPVGGPTTTIVSLRDRSVSDSYLATIASQSNLFFAKFTCRTKSDDIYKIISP